MCLLNKILFFTQNIVTLYKVHEAGGQVTSVKIAEKPLSQGMLDTNVSKP